MAIDFITIYSVFILFLATLVRSTFGFGESLVAVPLLALYLPIEIAVPVSVLASIVVAGVIVAQDWQKIHVRSAGWLVFFAALGIPFGLWLLTSTDERWVKASLAAILIIFSVYSLVGRSITLRFDNKLWLFLCGLLSGVLGGAYGLNGPPLVVYGAMRKWSAQHFRATLQGYFLPASLMGIVGYWLNGLWVMQVTTLFLWSLPAILLAIFLGRVINSRMNGTTFFRYVYIGLIGIGVVLLLQSLRPIFHH
ncbi:MAG TPA: sulfite exporter TauE/SafE family protein [Parapedobacter sp.]|uniref:sulfite exporter TauE/SafE family protein n=1 Tax=Parapedobacter sp. TaxID=1958893 RepID=UPI002C05C238|nr:sulfite exporter TauE/SafE family protein [Parapedobacter sp.]HWK59649.1 sulfite exporter TauE/SafE family protein [Parapedobacter sp.]